MKFLNILALASAATAAAINARDGKCNATLGKHLEFKGQANGLL